MELAKSRSMGDRIFDAVIFVFLTLIFLIVAYPLYFIIISSISDPLAVTGGKVVFLPIGLTFDGYNAVFRHRTILPSFGNSLYYTVVGVVINLVVTIPTSYAMSRREFFAKKPIMMFYMLTMFVSGGMMPTYLIIRDIGFLNSVWALVIPGALSVYNMIVARTFFQTNIPEELFEAAKLDGCGNTRFFLYVVLPLSSAIIAILTLYYGIGHWNSYYSALLYISERAKWPLQMELRTILLLNEIQNQNQLFTAEQQAEKKRLEALADMMKYSLIIISCIPVMVIYPFVQKHFVKGVLIGSVKG